MMIRRSRAIGPVVVGYPALLSHLSTVVGTSLPPEASAGLAGGTPVVPLYESPVAVGTAVDNAAETGVGVFEAPIYEAPQPPVEEVAVAAAAETLPVEDAPAEPVTPPSAEVEAPAEGAPVDPEPAVEVAPPAAEPEAAPEAAPVAEPVAAEPVAEPAKPAKKGPKAKAAPEAP